MAFIPSATVLVGLASQLTTSKTLIGLVSIVFPVFWYFPQLFAARIVRNKPNQVRYVIYASLIGRPMFLVIALWLILTRAADPLLTIWVIIGSVAIFNICDAVAGVAWFDIVGRALSPRMRARVFTFGQIGSGIMGLGASEIVKRVLVSPDLPFPTNYATLFLFTFAFLSVSLLAMFVVRERPMKVVDTNEHPVEPFGTALLKAARTDGLFRRVIAVRILSGLEAMAASFYFVFAKDRYGLGAEVEGNFTQAIVIGGLTGIMLFGWLAEHYTTRRVIHAAGVMYFAGPAIALACALFVIPANVAYMAFLFVFAMRGALEHNLVLGIVGYLLDTTPERNRAMYVGAINTLGGIVAFSPFFGGIWIDAFGTAVFNVVPYAVMFALITVLTICGFILSLRLPVVKSA